jgi:TldD protein
MWNRRELLAGLGLPALGWAFGCGPHAPARRSFADDGEIRTWLREAVARLAGAFPAAHALAVSRRRTTAAIDVLGAAVARGRADGVVLTVRGAHGTREQATSDLSRAGVAAAVQALLGTARPPAHDVAFGTPGKTRPLPDDPRALDDRDLLARVDAIARRDGELTSRIVYAATSIDIDDAMVWSVAPGRDVEQRLVRVRQAAARVAWNGTRPVVAEAARAWTGGLDARALDAAATSAATRAALELMTPGSFDDGPRPVALAPSVVAALIDAATGLLATSASRRPEVARRLALGAGVASAQLSLVDDPTEPGAYGGFEFDDEGVPAAPIALVDHGRVVGRLADAAGVAAQLAPVAGRGRRPGHLGPVAPAPSHLRLAPGALDRDALLDDGLALEGGLRAVVDPASDRFVVAASRAREVKAGRTTGRVFADVELVGELGVLLASIDGVARASESFGVRDEVDGRPRWRSIEAPWLRARGTVRARRSS